MIRFNQFGRGRVHRRQKSRNVVGFRHATRVKDDALPCLKISSECFFRDWLRRIVWRGGLPGYGRAENYGLRISSIDKRASGFCAEPKCVVPLFAKERTMD